MIYNFIGFFEERAIVLGKLGRHEQVLSMYVTVLHDVDRAIEYCEKLYESKNEDCDQVTLMKCFTNLFCFILKNCL